MRFLVFLFAALSATASFASQTVGLQTKITIDGKSVANAKLNVEIGNDFRIASADDKSQMEIEGDLYDCGDGTYTIHMNIAYAAEGITSKNHVSLTLLKNEPGLIKVKNESHEIALDLLIGDEFQ